MDTTNLILIFLFAFTAGYIDSVVGGGGLIQLPALLIFLPTMPIPTLMGTNKFAAFSGTSIATVRYVKQVDVPWKSILPAILPALIFSFIGAHTVSSINKDYIKVIVLVLLIIVAVYTFLKKDFGLSHTPKLDATKTIIYSLLTGAALGFYDGFFGPGTGSFLIVIFIGLFGFNFLVSSASAKLVNCATNVSALSYFIYKGEIDYELAIPVALFNMFGSFLGSKMAVKRGSTFVRKLFLVIVSGMILKLGYDVVTK